MDEASRFRALNVPSQRLEEIKEKKRQIERIHREFKVFFEAGESDDEQEEPPVVEEEKDKEKDMVGNEISIAIDTQSDMVASMSTTAVGK